MENEAILRSIEEFEANDVVHDLCDLKKKYLDNNCQFGFILSEENIEDYLCYF